MGGCPDYLGAWTTEEKHHGMGSIQKIIGKGERTVKPTRSYTYCGSDKQRQAAPSALPMPYVTEYRFSHVFPPRLSRSLTRSPRDHVFPPRWSRSLTRSPRDRPDYFYTEINRTIHGCELPSAKTIEVLLFLYVCFFYACYISLPFHPCFVFS
jgi:hypothetical protein